MGNLIMTYHSQIQFVFDHLIDCGLELAPEVEPVRFQSRSSLQPPLYQRQESWLLL